MREDSSSELLQCCLVNRVLVRVSASGSTGWLLQHNSAASAAWVLPHGSAASPAWWHMASGMLLVRWPRVRFLALCMLLVRWRCCLYAGVLYAAWRFVCFWYAGAAACTLASRFSGCYSISAFLSSISLWKRQAVSRRGKFMTRRNGSAS